MRVVGEDRLARRRARSRDHPFVRSAVAKRQQLAQSGVRLVRGGVARMERRLRRDRRIRGRRRKDPARLLGRKLPSELGPHDLEPVVVAELPSHQLAPDQRIRRLPGLRLVAEDHEFRRQGVGVRIEERVDAVDIGLQARLRDRRKRREAGFGEPIEPERADEAIDPDQVRPGDLGDPALADAPLDLHLIEALARVEPAERAHRVVHRRGEDVRHAVLIPPDARLRRKPRQSRGPRIFRHRSPEEPGAGGDRDENQHDDELRQELDQTKEHRQFPRSDSRDHPMPRSAGSATERASRFPMRMFDACGQGYYRRAKPGNNQGRPHPSSRASSFVSVSPPRRRPPAASTPCAAAPERRRTRP